MNNHPGIAAGASFDGLYYEYQFLSSWQFHGYPLVAILWNLLLLVVVWASILGLETLYQKTKFKTIKAKLGAVFLSVIWLAFFPNTAYIITDVRHLTGSCPTLNNYRICLSGVVPMIVFFVYASVGWVTLVYFLKRMVNFLKEFFSSYQLKLFVNFLIPLTSLGVLLGLIERWNSWQLFMMPLSILESASSYLTDSYRFSIWLIFSLCLYLLYYSGLKLFNFPFSPLTKTTTPDKLVVKSTNKPKAVKTKQLQINKKHQKK